MSAAMQRTLRKHIVLASLSVLTIQDPMQKKCLCQREFINYTRE